MLSPSTQLGEKSKRLDSDPITENDASPYTAPVTTEPSDSAHSSSYPAIAARAHHQGNAFSTRSLLVNVVIPVLILIAGAGFVVALGSVEPTARQADDDSQVGRLRHLPAAEVTQVFSLQEIGKPLELQVDGVVVPHREMQLAAEVSGRIIEKSPLCRAGNFVTSGQLLIKIDPTDYEQEVLRLSRMRDQEYEALKEVDQELANAKLSLDIAKQDIALAEREVSRLRALPRGFVSDGEQDQAQKAFLQSTQNRITIENQMNLLAARRGKLEAAERLATTQLETAKINLQRCEVRSVADGVIVREDAEVNSFIQRGSPIITIEDVSKAEVAVNLRMDQLYWVLDQASPNAVDIAQPGADGEINAAASNGESDRVQAPLADGRGGYAIPPTPAIIEYEVAGMGGRTYRWNGTLVRYDGIGLDVRSRTVPVKIEVEQPERRLRADGTAAIAASPSALVRGMYVRVKLLITPQTQLVAIPSDAMRPGNRVWQFDVDPSVLEESIAKPGDTVSTAASAGTSTSEDDFDPSLWTAGRVSVREKLMPVDSLYLSDLRRTDTASATETIPSESVASNPLRRYWICDAQAAGISSGDWVVVSPLGELGSEPDARALSVRVKTAEMNP